jgi:hypothetical protein
MRKISVSQAMTLRTIDVYSISFIGCTIINLGDPMKKLFFFTVVTFSLALITPTHAEVSDLIKSQTIGKIRVEKVVEEAILEAEKETTEKDLGEVVMVADTMIALGKKIWPIVEAGKPVVSARNQSISILPKSSADTFYELEYWQAPKTSKYRIVFENLYGVDVIDFTYIVTFQHGGEFEGKGQYLTGVNIIPHTIAVAWGFNFDAETKLVGITNRGNKLNPVAGATFEIKFVIKSVLKEIQSTRTFHVAGDGTFQSLN